MVVVGSDPVLMLTGPIPATPGPRRGSGVAVADIGAFEVNEAFASVPMAWLKETGADPELTTPQGGAIALGHPLGGTGARLSTTLLHRRMRREACGTGSRPCARAAGWPTPRSSSWREHAGGGSSDGGAGRHPRADRLPLVRRAHRRGRRRPGQPDHPRGLERAARLARGGPVDADHHAARRRRRHPGRVSDRRRPAAAAGAHRRAGRRRAGLADRRRRPELRRAAHRPGAAGPGLRDGPAHGRHRPGVADRIGPRPHPGRALHEHRDRRRAREPGDGTVRPAGRLPARLRRRPAGLRGWCRVGVAARAAGRTRRRPGPHRPARRGAARRRARGDPARRSPAAASGAGRRRRCWAWRRRAGAARAVGAAVAQDPGAVDRPAYWPAPAACSA